MPNREEDVKLLIEGVLEVQPEYINNSRSMSRDDWQCPFCHNEGEYESMKKINHKINCTYLIAQDLAT